jgi:hypothetical protein
MQLIKQYLILANNSWLMDLSWLITQNFGITLFALHELLLILILLYFTVSLCIELILELIVLLLLKHNFLQLKKIILVRFLHLRILFKEYRKLFDHLIIIFVKDIVGFKIVAEVYVFYLVFFVFEFSIIYFHNVLKNDFNYLWL